MDVRPINPRDIDTEVEPRYRVYFWSADRGRSDEFELTGAADVRDALSWAEHWLAPSPLEQTLSTLHPPSLDLPGIGADVKVLPPRGLGPERVRPQRLNSN